MKLSSKWYNILKWAVVLVLPVIAIVYSVVAKCADIPYTEDVLGGISAVEGVIGGVIGISNKIYYAELQSCDENEEY